MFEQSLVESNRGGCKPAAVAASSIGQVLIIGLLIVAPLLSTSELPQVWLTGILQAPAPPPPPPPTPVARRDSPARTVLNDFPAELIAPRGIPETVSIIIDEPAPTLGTGTSVVGSTGPSGGSGMNVVGSVLSTSSHALRVPPPPPPAPPTEVEVEPIRRVRIGGSIKAPVLTRQVDPVYPPLARQIRLEGTVLLTCIVGADGRPTSVKTVSGHPLLAPAAAEAVGQWRYQPTLLNGLPVEVVMQVTVNFRLR